MFERPHHQRIALVLQALDAARLAQNSCYFGGGTAIALRHGEFRESVDIDFLVCELAGYRALRQLLTGPERFRALAREGASDMLKTLREVRADQYGIRALVGTETTAIKFEIVFEARIRLDAPGPADRICGVATLTPLDMATSKLLANSDRWLDDAANCRDVIDLAMMRPGRKLLDAACAKAQTAYGESIVRDLRRAVERLGDEPQRLGRCMRLLKMDAPQALVWQRIRALLPRATRTG
ncbi:nucleotidyl transferase AbiEii/AbiGii toxin family protein [Ramlibacter albus]|uniref:Nucleotidyl transferase AbiEii/AbiGii toxin family protein n=1 Tax=Ramlibacter albus TaxID=2079448 RepID=A0A923S3H0_9BURK|nr:nucleotidyl transferase AbiEii/AbiGii toxin family protein [Ramlibacter albus]MBC5766549.1 nucleotidyl transferase AbiEii/AbiGii toxin family protein [Ramlibacter albus]